MNKLKYIIVEGYTIIDLKYKVNDKIKEGYFPIGTISVIDTISSSISEKSLCQPMVLTHLSTQIISDE